MAMAFSSCPLRNHLSPQTRSSETCLSSLRSSSIISSSPQFDFSSSRVFSRVHHNAIRCTSSSSSKEVQELDPKVGVSVYKPKSYEVLVNDAANSLVYALAQGKTRLEIEFPPLPTSMSSYKGSSDEFSDANVQLVVAIVRKLQEIKGTRTCIVFPDNPEKRRASEIFKTAIDTLACIGSDWTEKVRRCHAAEENAVIIKARAIKAEGELVEVQGKLKKTEEEVALGKTTQASLESRLKELEKEVQTLRKAEIDLTAKVAEVQKISDEEFAASAEAVKSWKEYGEGYHRKCLDLEKGIIVGIVCVEDGVVVFVEEDPEDDETEAPDGAGDLPDAAATLNEELLVPAVEVAGSLPQPTNQAMTENEVAPSTDATRAEK